MDTIKNKALLKIKGGDLELAIAPDTGRWQSLLGGTTGRSWLAPRGHGHAGLPIVGATGEDKGHAVDMICQQEGGGIQGKSVRGGCTQNIWGDDEALHWKLSLPDFRGPRSGLDLSLDHLDLVDSDFDRESILSHQVMPVMVATCPNHTWSYLVWQRNESDFLITAVDGLHAGWHILYSYAGHRMEGFRVYARADDVIAPLDRWPTGRLPAITDLTVHLARATSRESALKQIEKLLNLPVIYTPATSAVVSSTINLDIHHVLQHLEHIAPSGQKTNLSTTCRSLTLIESGIHSLRSTSAAGRLWETKILALGSWKELAERSLSFHREHYQLECGAFARAISGVTKAPDARTIEGTHFGNPEEPMSCRTGEFGGFGAWTQLLHQRRFGVQNEASNSIRAYFEHLCNVGREDNPLPGTLCFRPHEYAGRRYSAYHFYNEINYAQHEAWLIEQLSDAIQDGQEELMVHLKGLCRHYLDDHVDENGIIWNQNWDHEHAVDYSTVDCPMVHLISAGQLFEKRNDPLGQELLKVCRQQADHILSRGFDFPTEGEPCSDEGSIACAAWGLARAYNQLVNPNPEWLKLSKQLLAYHRKLRMSGLNIQTDGSTLRFWETMYETNNWGPSINAGHGWTIWSAHAFMEHFWATGDFEALWQCWRGTACVASKIQPDGSMPSCYTPDPIPSLPHDDAWGDSSKKYEGRVTTAFAGEAYPSCRAMSGMHLFLLAPRIWYRTCGYDAQKNRFVNAKMVGDTLIPNTPLPCQKVSLASLPEQDLVITGLDTEEVRLSLGFDRDLISIEGAEMKEFASSWLTLSVPRGKMSIIINRV